MSEEVDRASTWSLVHERIAKTNLEDRAFASGQMSDEEAERILDERARLLARPPRNDADVAGTDVLVFVVSSERYALDVAFVRETLRSAGVTEVPGTPTWFVGVENIRGEIVAVVDLDLLFGRAPPQHRTAGPLVVVGRDHAEFAIRCDELRTIMLLPHAAVRRMSRVSMTDERKIIVGVTDDALLVLDGEALLADERLFVDQLEET